MKGKSFIFATAFTAMISLAGFAAGAWQSEGRTAAPQTAPQMAPAYAAPDKLEIPFTIQPTEEEASWFTFHDVGGDKNTWKYGTAAMLNNAKTFYIRNNGTWATSTQDYLQTPAIEFAEAGMYVLTYEVATGAKDERFNVCINPNSTVLNDKIIQYNSDGICTNKAWETKTVKFTIDEACTRYISFWCFTPPGKGDILAIRNISLAKGSVSEPKQPTVAINFDGGDGTIDATMPTQTFDGNALTKTLTAHFSIDGGADRTVEAAPGAVASLPVTGLAEGNHTVSVYVSYDDDGTEVACTPVTESFLITAPSTLRYTLPLALDLGKDFNNLTIYDAAGDGFTWQPVGDAIKYSYTIERNADDWAFTRPVVITEDNADHILRMSIDAYSELSMSPQSFEVWVGTADKPSDMTQKIIDEVDINNTSYNTFAEDLALTPGEYVIGIHATSTTRGYLYVKNLGLVATSASTLTPAAPTNLYGEGDETGALKATIYFTYPTKAANGHDLDADADITVTATCGTYSASATGKPGASGSVTVDTYKGDNTITLTSSNSAGTGLYAVTVVNCGLDRPTTPRIMRTTVSEDNLSINILWRAVTTGVNEGIVNIPGMRYRVYLVDEETEERTLLTETDKTSYTYEVDANAQQFIANIGIEAINGPESVSPELGMVTAVLGKPYDLPIVETFEDGKYKYPPLLITSTQDPRYAPDWYLGDPIDLNRGAGCPDKWALIGHTRYSLGGSKIQFPKFSTSMESDDIDKEVIGFTVTFDIYMFTSTTPMMFNAICYGNETDPVPVGVLNAPATGWTTVEYDLPSSLFNKSWAAIINDVTFDDGLLNWALIDNYAITKKTRTSGVDEVGTSARTVTATRGGIILRGFNGTKAAFATIDGRSAGTYDINSDQYILSMPAGIYVVNTAYGAHKVIVK